MSLLTPTPPEPAPSASRRSRLRRATIGALTAAALVVMVAVALSATGSDGNDAIVSHAEPEPIGPGSEALSTPAISQLEWYALQGDRRTILVTGSRIDGEHGVNPAFVYDIARHTLARTTPAPFSPAADGVKAVRVGHHVVVTGTACRDVGDRTADPPIRECKPGTPVAARFNLRRRRWTRLAPPPVSVIPIGSAGTVAYYRVASPQPELVSFDDRSGQWTEIPHPPTPLAVTGCVLGRGDVIISTRDPRPDPNPGNVLATGLLLYGRAPGSATWRPIAPPPLRFFDEVTEHHANVFDVLCGAHGFLLTEYDLGRTWYFDAATEQWHDAAAPVSPDPTGQYASHVVVGDDFYLWTGAASTARPLVYDAPTRSWHTFVPGPTAQADDFGTDAVIDGVLYDLYSTRPGKPQLIGWTPRPDGPPT